MDLNILTDNIEFKIYIITSELLKRNYKTYHDMLFYKMDYKKTASKLAFEVLQWYQSQTEKSFSFVYKMNNFFTRYGEAPITKEFEDIIKQINIYIYVNYNKIDYDFKIWAEEPSSGEYLCGEL